MPILLKKKLYLCSGNISNQQFLILNIMSIENLHLSINETEALFSALQEYKTSCHCVMNHARADLIQGIIDKFDKLMSWK